MKRCHRMPYGAEISKRGTRFRMWAPAAQRVDLLLEARGGDVVVPLRASKGGWFQASTDQAGAGSRYRYRIDGETEVPDPASRYQPEDVHGPSEVIDPRAYEWSDAGWHGRPWHEAVLYELHVGAFTAEGTFGAAAQRLPYLRELGITAVELMPVADFPGGRNWGYDGVLPFAPDSRYGRPESLKALVDAAHRLGLMVFLDAVFNHFGPEGNYLHVYARDFFFSNRHQTPWGAAINFDGPGSRAVRDFYIHNALYWLEEFHIDGLRLDAVHAIRDDTRPHILAELAEAVRHGPGRMRRVHLVLENDDNAARHLERGRDGVARWYDAQWNDDEHHALHVLLTGERDGYYADYAGDPVRLLGRALAGGFSYQGEHSTHRRRPRGEPSGHLPPTAFVAFLQNHDQVGNRAFGERIAALASREALHAAYALLLLAPQIPLLFMGEEFGCMRPFPFFCDFGGELAQAVTKGRRSEFAAFARFADPAEIARIPDPNAEATFAMAVLDWTVLRDRQPAAWHRFVRALLEVRRREIVPRLTGLAPGRAAFEANGTLLRVRWPSIDGETLAVVANLGGAAKKGDSAIGADAFSIWPESAASAIAQGELPPWSVAWSARRERCS